MQSVLIIKSGSSSLRFALFHVFESLPRFLIGKFERIGLSDARLAFTDLLAKQGDERMIHAPNHVSCVPLLVELLVKNSSAVSAIGHRVVHGGPRYREPVPVDGAVLDGLRRISSFAPNHLPAAIALVEAFTAKFPRRRRSPVSTRRFTAPFRVWRSCFPFRAATRRRAFNVTVFTGCPVLF